MIAKTGQKTNATDYANELQNALETDKILEIEMKTVTNSLEFDIAWY